MERLVIVFVDTDYEYLIGVNNNEWRILQMEMRQCPADLTEERSERVRYTIPELYIFAEERKLSLYPNYAAVSHWHDELEFIAVLSGHMMYDVNGQTIYLKEGDGIFVNSKQLHYGYSEDYTECIFICILIHPLLLCSSHYVEQKYIAPVIHNEAFPFCMLHKETGWENEILGSLKKMLSCQQDEGGNLQILSLSFEIWKQLFEHAEKKEQLPQEKYYRLSTLKDMIGYIQQHYKEKITLDEVAAAGKVCKSNCCSIFQKYLKQTPVSYITHYRLKQSIDLMISSDMTITEISYETGFSGASYYTETFRRYFGTSPSEYRKGIQNYKPVVV
jgi:AraC-like DNA-binding protein/mannose-6-phosphate isomerase-like protein (cupin superfamily)